MTRNPGQFDWSLLRSLLAVIEEGSLQAAARRLESSQPTIGRHMNELESQLGTVLFERTGRGLKPTPTALSVAEHARVMQQGADALAQTLARQSTQAVGTVRVSASQVVATYLLPELLNRLLLEAPGIQIELVASNAVSNLLRREADIAVRMIKPGQPSLIARRIGRIELGAYAHEDYLRRRGTPLEPQDLLRHAVIGFDTDKAILDGFAQFGMTLDKSHFALRSDDHVVHWQAVRAGLGIGFAATWLARTDRSVRQVVPQLPLPVLPIWLTVHREIRSSRRIRLVYDYLAQAIPQAILR